jgi:hypothetical protein
VKNHRRRNVDPRHAVMQLVPQPPETVEAMLDTVRPIGEEGRQHDDGDCGPKPEGREPNQFEFRQQRQKEKGHQGIAGQGDQQCSSADPAPPAHMRHCPPGADHRLQRHHQEKHERQRQPDCSVDCHD